MPVKMVASHVMYGASLTVLQNTGPPVITSPNIHKLGR